MAEDSQSLLAGEYFLAVEGLAMIRTCLVNAPKLHERVEEVKELVANLDRLPNAVTIPIREYDVDEGYTRWAPRYDGPNAAIRMEEPVVRSLFEDGPRGSALDAACGTGRHAEILADLGFHVTGIDANEAMVAVARSKLPDVEFRLGRLEDLPADDGAFDLISCGLALTHVTELEPAMREFARVLRPQGRCILSDIHPFATMTGAMAAFPREDITAGIPFVVNRTHHLSDYVSAFQAAGLVVRRCLEPLITEEMLGVFPSYRLYPEATRVAFCDTPYLVVWELQSGLPVKRVTEGT